MTTLAVFGHHLGFSTCTTEFLPPRSSLTQNPCKKLDMFDLSGKKTPEGPLERLATHFSLDLENLERLATSFILKLARRVAVLPPELGGNPVDGHITHLSGKTHTHPNLPWITLYVSTHNVFVKMSACSTPYCSFSRPNVTFSSGNICCSSSMEYETRYCSDVQKTSPGLRQR